MRIETVRRPSSRALARDSESVATFGFSLCLPTLLTEFSESLHRQTYVLALN